MANSKKSAAKQFICSCKNELLFKHQIMIHLKTKGAHNVTKIAPPQTSEKFQNSILNKIENIAKTKNLIQASSNQLIQIITQNTSVIIQKLSNLIKFYRHLLLNPPQLDHIKHLQVINIFNLNPTLCTALAHHFEQQPVAVTSTLDTIARKVKTQVMDITRNHDYSKDCMAVFSDEKRVVTGGFDGAVRIWDLQTKSLIWSSSLKQKAFISSLALGKEDDLVLTGSGDATVRLWNVKLKSQIHKFVGHTFAVTSVLFSQDQSTGFSGSMDGTIRSWNLKKLTFERTIPFPVAFTAMAIFLIAEEKIIVACSDIGPVQFFNLKNNKHSKTSNHSFAILTFCFTPNEEQFITGSIEGTVEVWVTNGLKRHFFQKSHTENITSIQISACSKFFATGSTDRTVIVWDFNKLQAIKQIQNLSIIRGLYFAKNSSSILIYYNVGISWCSLTTFKNEVKIKVKQLKIIAISSDLKYAAYGLSLVCLIDIGSKTKVAKSSSTKKPIICLKFSPSNAYLGAGCLEGEITILSIPNLVQLTTLYTKLSGFYCLSFSISNEFIGFSDGSAIMKVMSIKTKKVLYENDVRNVHSICFCSNDEKVFYSDFDSIYVMTKNFSFLTKISLGNEIEKMFVNEDNSYVLVISFNRRLSLIKAKSLKKIFENESKKVVKEWCTIKHDMKLGTILLIPNIEF